MSLPGELRTVPHVAEAFAELVTDLVPRSIALSGGETARHCYEMLVIADLDWSAVSVFFGDERWVPVNDPDSNEECARTAFLDGAGIGKVHSLRGAGETPDEAAVAYDALLRREPPIDLIHLGLGPDGHTASLFPGTSALDESERLVVPNRDDAHPHPRVTFTFPAIARCRVALVTVAGTGKREALRRIRDGEDLPAAHISAGEVIWLVDPAAAGSD